MEKKAHMCLSLESRQLLPGFKGAVQENGSRGNKFIDFIRLWISHVIHPKPKILMFFCFCSNIISAKKSNYIFWLFRFGFIQRTKQSFMIINNGCTRHNKWPLGMLGQRFECIFSIHLQLSTEIKTQCVAWRSIAYIRLSQSMYHEKVIIRVFLWTNEFTQNWKQNIDGSWLLQFKHMDHEGKVLSNHIVSVSW